MDASVNAINWFEISVEDMGRAKHFYQVVFSMHMEETEMMGMKMTYFPAEMGNGKVSGALVQGSMHKPSAEGAVLYLNGNPDLNDVLSKVESVGGKVLMPKQEISPEIGYMAFFMDSEGNRIGLHSNH
jgi:predicted enzyme related to lactoylglutathione lyase